VCQANSLYDTTVMANSLPRLLCAYVRASAANHVIRQILGVLESKQYTMLSILIMNNSSVSLTLSLHNTPLTFHEHY
jgi:hypothetical protein